MAKFEDSYQHPLTVREVVLQPGDEWAVRLPGWSMILVVEGTAYWLHPQQNRELGRGAVLLVKQGIEGTILASQLGAVSLEHFCIEPQRLTGLITLSEQRMFETEGNRVDFAPRLLPPESDLSGKLTGLHGEPNRNTLAFRTRVLLTFLEAFEQEFKPPGPQASARSGAEERLRSVLEKTPASEMLEMRFSFLVQKTMCTPRHLNRVFRAVVGKSFRETQTDLRLRRASELLATTESKVLEVAMESGYQSLSLFNLVFKRRFGMTPGSWRVKVRGQQNGRRRFRRFLPPQNLT